MPRTLLLYAPVNKGIILECAAYLASFFRPQSIQVILQTASSPEWPQDLPPFKNLVSNLKLPSMAVKYGGLAWAINRYQMALQNGIQRLLCARRVKADIVHMQFVVPWIDATLLPLHRRTCAQVSTVHDVLPHVLKLPARIDLMLRKRCYASCDGLIFHSATNAKQFEQTYGLLSGRSTVIPLGLRWQGPVSEQRKNLARERLRLPQDRAIVLAFGEVRPNKGLHVLLDAFIRVLSDKPDAFLLVAGSVHPSVDLGALEQKFQMLPRQNYRWDRGWIPDGEMELYFQSASVVVLPYTNFSSQSGVLAKAYSYECPMVVTDVGSMGETVREDGSGLVVEPGQPIDLAATLYGLLSDSCLQNQFRRNIIDAAQEKYAWDRVAARTAEFYERILDKGA